MARLISCATNTAIALSSGTRKTIIGIVAPVNQDLEIVYIGLSTDNADVGAIPILAELIPVTGGSSTTNNVPRILRGTGTLRTSFNLNYTSSPTYDVNGPVWVRRFHPSAGFDIFFPPLSEPIIFAGVTMGVAITSAAALNAIPTIWLRE